MTALEAPALTATERYAWERVRALEEENKRLKACLYDKDRDILRLSEQLKIRRMEWLSRNVEHARPPEERFF